MKIPFGKPIIEEEEKAAVLAILDNPILVHGPKSIEFEKAFAEYTAAPDAISVSSCTAGLHLMYIALGISEGDEVIVPAQTHIATAHAVELVGATPVFVDAEPETGNIDLSAIEEKISSKTKAISVVHYLGVPLDMPKLMQIAEKHSLRVIEDCALSLGAYVDGVHTGLYGDAGVFSFYPVKHITTAEGGMIILKDTSLSSVLRLKKAFGVDRTHGERKIPGMYDTVDLGLNYRMSEIHAALGVEQIKKANRFIEKRKENFETLHSTLLSKCPGITILPQSQSRIQSSYYCLSVVLDEKLAAFRPQIMAFLSEKGVGSSVYYPQPVPRMSYYAKKYGYDASAYPNAARLSDCSIALPVGPHLSIDDMEIIAEVFSHALREVLS